MKIYREVGSLYIVNRKDAEGYERPVYEIEVDEAEPIRHGKWIMEFDEKSQVTDWRCSACGKHGRGDYERCPWCGAKMDEVTE